MHAGSPVLGSHSIGAASGTYLKSMERKTIASLDKALEVFIRLLHDTKKKKRKRHFY